MILLLLTVFHFQTLGTSLGSASLLKSTKEGQSNLTLLQRIR